MAEARPGGRIAWVDATRGAGAIGVVILHVVGSSVSAAGGEGSSAACAWLSVLATACGRWCVPAFLMLSGLLTLGDDAHAARVGPRWGARHAARLALAILLFGWPFATMSRIWEALSQAAGAGASPALAAILPSLPAMLAGALCDVLLMRTWDHMWYLYAMAGAYLLLPLVARALRLGEAGGGRRLAVAAGMASAAMLAVPTAMGYAALARGEGAPMLVLAPGGGTLRTLAAEVAIAVTCMLVGGWVPRAGQAEERRVALLGGASWAAMCMTQAVGIRDGFDASFALLHGSALAASVAACVVMLMRLAGEAGLADGSSRAGRLLGALAAEGLGVYAIHPLFVHLLVMAAAGAGVPVAVTVVIGVPAVLALSWASARALRRLPPFRDVL